MPTTEMLSTYSDWTYGAAVAVYVLAMVFSFVEQALRRTRAQADAKVLVGAAGPEGTEVPEGTQAFQPGRA
jgi:hypothetical protein